MKKIRILSALIIVSLLVSLMLIPISAYGDKATVSEDYSHIEYNGKNYIRVNPDDIYFMNYSEYCYSVEFEGGDSMVESAECSINSSAIELSITYKKGGNAYYYYISEYIYTHFENYVKNGGGDVFAITFWNTTVSSGRDNFFSTELVIPGYELNYYSMEGSVFSPVFDNEVCILCGYLLSDDEGNFYYVDYIKSSDGTSASLDMQKDVKIWQITDKELISLLKEAMDGYAYSGDDIYYDDDDGTGLGIGIVLLFIMLGIIPLVGAIASFCISFKCDKQFRLRLRIISALCLLAVVVTVITVIACLVIAV